MEKNFEDRALDRIRGANDSLSDFKRKVHRLRRLVAGDVSALDDGRSDAGSSRDDGGDFGTGWASGTDELYPILVNEFEEGRSNKLLVLIRTLVFQSAYSFPEIEFEDVPTEVGAVNSAYCRRVLGSKPNGCDARHGMRLALLDCLIGGVGWSYACLEDGNPSLRQVDCLDMSWDLGARFPMDATWASCKTRKPLWYWRGFFGKKDWVKWEKANPGEGSEDRPVELEFYYDTEGEGRFAVLSCGNGEEEGGVTILVDSNPCRLGDQPFLPFTPQYSLALPSVRVPIGLAETMLPHQVARWTIERRMRDVLSAGPIRIVDEQAVTQEQWTKFLESDETGQALFARGLNAVADVPAAQIDPTDIQYLNLNDSEQVAQSGANPYATGDKVEGVSYAAEVNAIQSSASLMAGVIARDHAEFWTASVRKFMALAAQFETRDMDLVYDDVPVRFDASNPIKAFLRPDARISIEEDTMSYRSREQRIAEAKMRLDVALGVAQMFPGGLKKAYEDLLIATGVKNLAPWLEQPAQAQPMASPVPQ